MTGKHVHAMMFYYPLMLAAALLGHVVVGPASLPGTQAFHQTSALALRSCLLPVLAVPPDTLRQQVQAGEVLIFNLPATRQDRNVLSYDAFQLPALSWLARRSFFWRTTEQDAGTHLLRFRTNYRNAPPDTLWVEIEVAAPDS